MGVSLGEVERSFHGATFLPRDKNSLKEGGGGGRERKGAELIRLNCTCNVARRRGGDGSGGGLLLFPAENEVQGERDDDERERAACLRWLLPCSLRPPARPSSILFTF